MGTKEIEIFAWVSHRDYANYNVDKQTDTHTDTHPGSKPQDSETDTYTPE